MVLNLVRQFNPFVLAQVGPIRPSSREKFVRSVGVNLLSLFLCLLVPRSSFLFPDQMGFPVRFLVTVRVVLSRVKPRVVTLLERGLPVLRWKGFVMLSVVFFDGRNHLIVLIQSAARGVFLRGCCLVILVYVLILIHFEIRQLFLNPFLIIFVILLHLPFYIFV